MSAQERHIACKMAKAVAFMCLKDLMHKSYVAGTEPVSVAGDFTDVFVTDGQGNQIAWTECRRLSRDEQEKIQAKKEHRQPVLIPHFSVHNLRHTFCTRLCENENDLKIIQEIMGHSDITTTMNIYNEATKERKQESFARLEGKIKIC